jgi:cytidylate kinase
MALRPPQSEDGEPANPGPGGPTLNATPTANAHSSDRAEGLIVTIDGPAGTGKSTVARELAKRTGLDFLDTGAMYRAATALVIDAGIDRRDPRAVCRLVEAADLHFDWSRDPPAIYATIPAAPGPISTDPATPPASPTVRYLGDRVREPDVTAEVSPMAGIAPLREHMVRKQQLIARQHPYLVTEGRDQGTVAFPSAALKIYLTASPAVRAARRADQLRERGCDADEELILAEIIERDRSDQSRAVGPLARPHGSVEVDTSFLTFDQVVARLEAMVRPLLPRVIARPASRGQSAAGPA